MMIRHGNNWINSKAWSMAFPIAIWRSGLGAGSGSFSRGKYSSKREFRHFDPTHIPFRFAEGNGRSFKTFDGGFTYT